MISYPNHYLSYVYLMRLWCAVGYLVNGGLRVVAIGEGADEVGTHGAQSGRHGRRIVGWDSTEATEPCEVDDVVHSVGRE